MIYFCAANLLVGILKKSGLTPKPHRTATNQIYITRLSSLQRKPQYLTDLCHFRKLWSSLNSLSLFINLLSSAIISTRKISLRGLLLYFCDKILKLHAIKLLSPTPYRILETLLPVSLLPVSTPFHTITSFSPHLIFFLLACWT
jgi:hypothetical protein